MEVRRTMLGLIAGAIVLPIGLCVLFLIWQLLEALGDATGGYWLRRAGILLLFFWGIDLVVLLLLTAWRQLQTPHDPADRT